jgi:hypothetical protein
MRPRDQLRGILLHHGWGAPEVDFMLDAFAHELAERQRAWIDSRSDLPWWTGEIPDLIDPKAQGASTEGDNS